MQTTSSLMRSAYPRCAWSRSRRAWRAAFTVLWTSAIIASAPAQVLYTLTNIGAQFGNTSSAAFGINNSGQVVGSTGLMGSNPYVQLIGGYPVGHQMSGNAQHGFVYSGGTATILSPSYYSSLAIGINDSGLIVGGAQATLNSGDHYAATSWSNGVPTNLTTGTSLAAYQSLANSVNNSGQIAGVGNSTANGFVVTGGALTILPSNWQPYAINGTGQTAGSGPYLQGSGGSYAILPGYNGGHYGAAVGINNAGVAVGYAPTPSYFNALLWSGGGVIDIAPSTTSNSYALDINNFNQVVGSTDANGAFVYQNGTLTNLNSVVSFSGTGISYLYQATAINDLGQIVGVGLGTNGYQTAFLLTPVSAIPEPATYVMVVGVMALGWAVWRRARARA